MESSMAIEWGWMEAMNSEQTSTYCCFLSFKISFGTHLADFFSRPKYSWRIAWIVDIPWLVIRVSMFSWWSSSMPAAIEAMGA
jgi:hypothetical protein